MIFVLPFLPFCFHDLIGHCATRTGQALSNKQTSEKI